MVQLAQLTETAPAIDRSGRMETLIDDADAALRELPSDSPLLIGKWRDAAYGLRGVRVGEASLPGFSDSESDTVSLPGS